MKKTSILLIILLLMVTGCGKGGNNLDNNKVENSVVQKYEDVKFGTKEPISFMNSDVGELFVRFYGKYSYEVRSNISEEEVYDVFVKMLGEYVKSLGNLYYNGISTAIDEDELLKYVNTNSENIFFIDVTLEGYSLTDESLKKIKAFEKSILN